MKEVTKFIGLFILILLLIGLSNFVIASVTYVDSAGLGSPKIQPQVSDAAPSEPYDCVAAQEGRIIYVDDTNDGAESYVCFCGVDADDTSYEWFKVQDPAVNCF